LGFESVTQGDLLLKENSGKKYCQTIFLRIEFYTGNSTMKNFGSVLGKTREK
jgi:hypothetical protein